MSQTARTGRESCPTMMICPNGTIKVRRPERVGSRVRFRSKRTITLEPLVNLPMRTSASTEAARKTTAPGVHGGFRSIPNASNIEENQIAVAPCSLGSSLICLREDFSELGLLASSGYPRRSGRYLIYYNFSFSTDQQNLWTISS